MKHKQRAEICLCIWSCSLLLLPFPWKEHALSSFWFKEDARHGEDLGLTYSQSQMLKEGIVLNFSVLLCPWLVDTSLYSLTHRAITEYLDQSWHFTALNFIITTVMLRIKVSAYTTMFKVLHDWFLMTSCLLHARQWLSQGSRPPKGIYSCSSVLILLFQKYSHVYCFTLLKCDLIKCTLPD